MQRRTIFDIYVGISDSTFIIVFYIYVFNVYLYGLKNQE